MAYENKFKVKIQLRLILLADDFIIYSVKLQLRLALYTHDSF